MFYVGAILYGGGVDGTILSIHETHYFQYERYSTLNDIYKVPLGDVC